MSRMQAAAQRPVNLSLRRIEYHLQPLVLPVVLRVGKRSTENNQSCNYAVDHSATLESHTPRPPSGQVRRKTRNLLECARQDAWPADEQRVAAGPKTNP